MTPIGKILDLTVAIFRSTPELVALVANQPERIYHSASLPLMRSVTEAVSAMQPPSIMIACTGATMPENWMFHFQVHLSFESLREHYEAFSAFVDGFPQGSQVRLLDYEIEPSFYPIENVALERQIREDGIESWYVSYAIRETGG